MSAELPAELGWRNPLLSQATDVYMGPVIVPEGPSDMVTLRDAPSESATALTDIGTTPGDRFTVDDVRVNDAWPSESSAEAYAIWGRFTVDGVSGWARLVEPSPNDTGSDGRPSSVRFRFVPAE